MKKRSLDWQSAEDVWDVLLRFGKHLNHAKKSIDKPVQSKY